MKLADQNSIGTPQWAKTPAATTAEAAKAGFFQLRLVARGHCEYGPMTSGVVVADIVISIAFVDADYLTPVSFSAMSAKWAKRFIRFRSASRDLC